MIAIFVSVLFSLAAFAFVNHLLKQDDMPLTAPSRAMQLPILTNVRAFDLAYLMDRFDPAGQAEDIEWLDRSFDATSALRRLAAV